MQPMINPNYFNQFPMYQPQQQGTRLVSNFNEIQVNEIPMDGSYKLFAKADMSEVQAKCWGSNGLINTLIYKLENSPKQPLEKSDTDNSPTIDLSLQFEPILAEIKAINTKIDKLSKVGGKKNESDGNS